MTDHSHEALAHKGDPSLDRLLFFSDGVFAIAITLLSIELHAPHGWDGTFGHLVRDGGPMLASFALSFAVIGVLWNAHRRAFLRMTRFTAGVFGLNLVLLAGVALMPFATQLLYSDGPAGEAFAIYLTLVSVIGLVQGLTYGYAAFVADAVRPRQHAMMRLSALLMQGFMPGLCCAFGLFAFSNAPRWWVGVTVVLLALLIGFRVFAGKRFGPREPA
jgi:uncharacterized membrane protein